MNWKKVLEYKKDIENICKSLNTNCIDYEDFLQQSMLNIASNFHMFDPKRGTLNTFLYWRVMATRRLMLYREKKHVTNVVGTPLEDFFNISTDIHEKMEKKVEFSVLYSKMNSLEKEACDTILNDVPTKDLPMNYYARMGRIYRLRDRLRK